MPKFYSGYAYTAIGQDEIENLQQTIRTYANELPPDKMQVKFSIPMTRLSPFNIIIWFVRLWFVPCMPRWHLIYKTECSPRRLPNTGNAF